jgi:uncharacterized integral membrane protein (TIGR00697 family)
MKKTQKEIYPVITSIFVGCLLISNILASKTIAVGNFIQTAGIIIFPMVFCLSDILGEVYGFKLQRQAIYTSLVMNIIAILLYTIAIKLPPSPFFEGQEAFETVLSTTWRIVIASLIAYITGSLFDAYTRNLLAKYKDKFIGNLFNRCILSTAIGNLLDSLIFLILVFIGKMPFISIFSMVILQTVIKTLYQVVIFPIIAILIKKFKQLPVE